jgi:hypothetical protein
VHRLTQDVHGVLAFAKRGAFVNAIAPFRCWLAPAGDVLVFAKRGDGIALDCTYSSTKHCLLLPPGDVLVFAKLEDGTLLLIVHMFVVNTALDPLTAAPQAMCWCLPSWTMAPCSYSHIYADAAPLAIATAAAPRRRCAGVR